MRWRSSSPAACPRRPAGRSSAVPARAAFLAGELRQWPPGVRSRRREAPEAPEPPPRPRPPVPRDAAGDARGPGGLAGVGSPAGSRWLRRSCSATSPSPAMGGLAGGGGAGERGGEGLGVALPLQVLLQRPHAGRAGLAPRGFGAGRPPPCSPSPATIGLPLSFAQQRLWFLHQLEPGSPLYNLPARGAPERACWTLPRWSGPSTEVVRRHESLRTTVLPSRAGPVAAHLRRRRGECGPRVDLGALPAPEGESEALRLAQQEALRPFNLARGPLLRTRCCGWDTEHVLLLSLHHLVSDGCPWACSCARWPRSTPPSSRPAPTPSRAGRAVRRLRRSGSGSGSRARSSSASCRTGAAARGRSHAPGAAHGQAASSRARPRRRQCARAPVLLDLGGPQGSGLARGRDALHAPAGRLPGAAPPPLGRGRHQRGHAHRRPHPRPDAGPHRLLRQHAGAAHPPGGQPLLPRAARARAGDGAGRLRPPGRPLREAGGGTCGRCATSAAPRSSRSCSCSSTTPCPASPCPA